jgi:hypothetical protein
MYLILTSENLIEEDILGDFDLDGRIILKYILKKWDVKDVHSIPLAQYREQWRALVNTVMKLWVS